MGIGRKVLVLNITLAMVSVLLVFIVGHQIWNTSYLALEKHDVRDNTNRAYEAWKEEIDVLSSFVGDWAPWDETYYFAKQPWDSEFEKKNLDDAAMENINVDMVILADPYGHIIYAKKVKMGNVKEKIISDELSVQVKRINDQLPSPITRENNIKGFIMLSDGPALVAAQRIATSEFEGPSPGVLIFIRNIDDEHMKKVAKRVQVEMSFSKYQQEPSVLQPNYWQTINDERQVKGYQIITDIYGHEKYLLETTIPRDIYQQGQQQMKSYAILTLLFGVGITTMTLILFENLVFKRLRKLDGFMKNIGDGGNIIERLQLSGNDEFSRTAATMNRMLDQVQQTQEKLRKLSLYDGLTGLYNRNFFEQEINQMIGEDTRSIGVISCDVDGLKFANDTLGHSVGDEMLVQTSHIITQVLGNQGKAIRMGGDEFIILLFNVDEEYIKIICGKIKEALQQINVRRNNFNLQLSMGWEYDDIQPIDRELILNMIRKADDGMYRQKLANSFEKRRLMMQEIMEMLNRRDYLNEGHGDRVADMARRVGEAIGLDESKLDHLRILGKFHDVGKVGIADEIIVKYGMLTVDEKIEMERHSEIGYRIAQMIPELIPIADFILKHHEWWNGQGYPIGLQGLEIPIEDRILSIVDAYDEMTSDRPYRKAMTQDDALAELQRLSSIQFDAELVQIFKKII
ncbi:HD domain-containing phosphohydrolase [Pelosinus sp. sgz500959]|uniref:HD domain-containing phosphohydrolase n=1 Tax=Pelosinus sp. sgz500959 TaxID=3242472 RepID=UPI00366AD103